MAVAIRHQSLAAVIFDDGALFDWRTVEKPARKADLAARQVKSWLQIYQPHVVVSENPDTAKRKAERQKTSLAAIAKVFEDDDAMNILLARHQNYANRFAEAQALAERFPVLKGYDRSATRKFWDPEDYYIPLFEALKLALQVLDDPAFGKRASLPVHQARSIRNAGSFGRDQDPSSRSGFGSGGR